MRPVDLLRGFSSVWLTPSVDKKEVPSSTNARQSRASGSPTENPRRERLHPILAEQRREAVSGSKDAQDGSSDAAPRNQTLKFPRRSGPPRKRVDLYLNETGYPQSRTPMPGHENQELHSKRREHLAPHPPDAAADALSGFVDAVAEHSKVSRPPRRRSEGANSRPSGFRVSSYPEKANANRASSGQQNGERQRLPGLRDRQSRFKTQGGPGGNRSGPGGVMRRPGQQRPGRGPSKSVPVPVKMFDPAPQTVVGAHRNYNFASKLPSKGEVAKVQMNMFKAQWAAQRSDIEKVYKGTGSATTVLRGNWQTYISPVFEQIAEAQEKKKSSHGVARDQRKEVLERAAWGVALNPSLQLRQKLQVTEKVNSLL